MDIFNTVLAARFEALLQVGATLLAFLLGLLADPIKRFVAHPCFEFYFDKNIEDYCALTLDVDAKTKRKRDALYVRIKLINKSWTGTTAKNCRAYLVGIESENDVLNPNYCDSIPLAWSCRQVPGQVNVGYEFAPLELPCNIEQFIDIFFILENIKKITPATSIHPLRYQEKLYPKLYREAGAYTFRIRISGDNFKTIEKRLKVNWIPPLAKSKFPPKFDAKLLEE